MAFRVGEIPEWLLDGETGFLVEPKDVDALAERLELLLNDPALAQRLGLRGRQVAEERFTLDRHVDGSLRIFESALGARGARPTTAGAGITL